MQFNLNKINRILITGGAGFIGSALIRNLLKDSSLKIYNLDKLGYASDLSSINNEIKKLNITDKKRHELLKIDLLDEKLVDDAFLYSDPDLVVNLAAESHVDKSIVSPRNFIESNIVGTFNLLEAARKHWNKINQTRKENFKFLHVSTDEVFGSLDEKGRFSEISSYDPRSPYSASKASSDHLVKAWYHTYSLPTIVTNCSNNYGPWQYPEKLIPLVIKKAISNETIPIYGDGFNIRDWLFVEDHIEALLLVLKNGVIGENYCIGGSGERTNNQVVNMICEKLDLLIPKNNKYSEQIIFVKDRLGHDKRYAINPTKIVEELNWKPKFNFEKGLDETIQWYLNNRNWFKSINQ